MEPETKVGQTPEESAQNEQMNNQSTETAAKTTSEAPTGASEVKVFAIIGYILPFLFFLPLINDKTKNDPFAKFHANQQLILLILWIAISFLSGTLMMVLMGLGYLVVNLLNLALLALAIYGALNAYKGETKELPFIGQFKILK